MRYEDSEIVKPRPVIFIDANSYTILQLSSKTQHEGYIIKDWKEAGLEKPSVIRTDRRVALEESDVKSYIGILTERDLIGFLNYLREHPPSHRMIVSFVYSQYTAVYELFSRIERTRRESLCDRPVIKILGQ